MEDLTGAIQRRVEWIVENAGGKVWTGDEPPHRRGGGVAETGEIRLSEGIRIFTLGLDICWTTVDFGGNDGESGQTVGGGHCRDWVGEGND